jgi:diketogulonate reductase-like aldo/keto reductase
MGGEKDIAYQNGLEVNKILDKYGIKYETSTYDAGQTVKDAVDIGYRHIDTAQAYQNESGVGDGIREGGVKREEMFVATKLAAEVKSYKEAIDSIDQSLKTLGLDYIGMMLIHSPQPWAEFGGEDRYFDGNREAWRALEEAYKGGKLRAIGLSNFEKADVDNILGSGSGKPMVNQILVHISNTPKELIRYCEGKDILVEAYSPIAHGELMNIQKVAKMAEKYDVSVP